MLRKRPLPENDSRIEPSMKKTKTNDRDKILASKDALLKALSKVEDEAKELKQESLSEKLESLRTHVEDVLERHENEIKRLNDEKDDDRVVLERQANEIKRLNAKIDVLRKEVDDLKRERKELKKTFAIAQATWAWEAHLARFVINSTANMWKFGKLRQMNQYLETVKEEDNLWMKIIERIGFGQWTENHREMVDTVRKERNAVAHPQSIDLDLVKAETKKMGPIYGTPMLNMLDVLSMTASLMKFGRLAKLYQANKRHFPVVRLNDAEEKVLKVIISWDRRFEDIHGLQHVKHEEAKIHVEKYVKDAKKIGHYFSVVDLLKKENGKKLGKWASELKNVNVLKDKERHVVNELKKLAPKDSTTQDPERRGNAGNLRNYVFATIAKLHVPDFLPKSLWEQGVKFVENQMKSSPAK